MARYLPKKKKKLTTSTQIILSSLSSSLKEVAEGMATNKQILGGGMELHICSIKVGNGKKKKTMKNDSYTI